MIPLIGLVGFANSGKGTIGSILEKEYGFIQDSFASIVKDVISKIFDWDRNLLEGSTEESRIWREKQDLWWSKKLNLEVTPRKMMQMMGTDAGRNIFGQNVWISSLEKRFLKKALPTVITDIRFPNELKWVKSMRGTNIAIFRNKKPEWYKIAYSFNQGNYEKLPDELKNIHPSERDWIGNPNIDWEIKNDSTIEDLNTQIKFVHDQYITSMKKCCSN